MVAQFFVPEVGNQGASHVEFRLERWRLELDEESPVAKEDTVGLSGNLVAQGLLPDGGDAVGKDHIVQLGYFEILAQDFADGLFISSLHNGPPQQ